MTPFWVRVQIAAASLRTNLTVRELAAVFGISKSRAQRVIDDRRAVQPAEAASLGFGRRS